MDFFSGDYWGRFIGLEGHIHTISEGYAIIITAVLIVIGWYAAERNSTNSHRRQNAHKYIIEHNSEIKELILHFSDNLKKNSPFPVYTHSSSDEKDGRKLLDLLAKMEIISVDVKHGLVSEGYINSAQGGVIVKLFELSKPFISSLRIERKHHSAYKNYECLYLRFKYRKQSYFQRLIEFVFNKPMFDFTYFMFNLKYRLYSLFSNIDKDYMKETPENVVKAVSIFDRFSTAAYLLIAAFIYFKFYIYV